MGEVKMNHNMSGLRFMIFDEAYDEHHPEYLMHLLNYALQNESRQYFFVVHERFMSFISEISLPSNINFDPINGASLNNIKGNVLRKSYHLNKILQHYDRNYRPDKIFLPSIMQFLPFLPFMIKGSAKVSGIVYFIYLYRWQHSKVTEKFQDAIKYRLFANRQIFEKIFILNDAPAARHLNKLFNTRKFCFLPDPLNEMKSDSLEDIRSQLNIGNKKILLHFDDMAERKGTLEILKAIPLIEERKLQEYCFLEKRKNINYEL